jgi:hypothetical protein
MLSHAAPTGGQDGLPRSLCSLAMTGCEQRQAARQVDAKAILDEFFT